MIVSTVHKVSEAEEAEFFEQATQWLTALGQLPGWITGSVARSVDEVDTWLIHQEWIDAGSCRRGLSTSQLRPLAFAIAKSNLSQVSTFEQLVVVTKDEVREYKSDRASDADTFSLSATLRQVDEIS
jgi:heme oxygenase (mycobilin-producing)